MSGGKHGQTLFYRVLSATARGLTSKTAVNWHLKVKYIEYNVGLTKNYCITVNMQKISLIHILILRILGSHGQNCYCPILTTSTKKLLKLLLAFLIFHQHAKKQCISSTSYWNTFSFRVLWPGWSQPISDHVHPKIFGSTFNLYELASTCKKSGYFIDLFWRYGWLKSPAIWLLRKVWLINQEKIFSQIWDLCRNTANINFHYC